MRNKKTNMRVNNCFLIQMLIFLVLIFISINCQGNDQSTPSSKTKIVKFHTEIEEGRWQNMSNNHLPQVAFLDKRQVIVAVELKPMLKPRHYIEVIFLLNKEKKEVATKKFLPSLLPAKARFILPPNKSYQAVAKCNLHGMWLTNIVFPKPN